MKKNLTLLTLSFYCFCLAAQNTVQWSDSIVVTMARSGDSLITYRQGKLTQFSPTNEPGSKTSISIFPNPVTSGSGLFLEIHLKQRGLVRMEWTDGLGNVVQRFEFPERESGNQIFELKTMEVPPGPYFLTAWLNGEVLATEKVIFH
jgi:hypothetical protein